MKYQEILKARIIPPHLLPLIQKAGQNNVPILIQGETGVGKEQVAKIIHQWAEKPRRFYRIDCKMVKENSLLHHLSSLLRTGRSWETPITLFLKEIEYLGPADQSKLLELMEEDLLSYPGGRKGVVENVRWIASSSDDLRAKVAQGNFSRDLFDRLSALFIYIPPLRDRNEDIPILARHLLLYFANRMNLKNKEISDNVVSLLKRYWWPGNLKELEAVILRSAILSEGECVTEKDLYFSADGEGNSFCAFLRRGEIKDPLELNDDPYVSEQRTLLLLTELIHRIKNPLVSIKTFTQLLQEKFNDEQYRESFYEVVSEDIDKIDSFLNGLTEYVKINTPLPKRNTVHQILEEILSQYEGIFRAKEIRVVKRFKKDLPETMVPDEPLRYIFHSLLQYVVPSIPTSGTLGFLTRVSSLKRGRRETSFCVSGKEFIEILIIFKGLKKPVALAEIAFGISPSRDGDTLEFELRLIHEILKKHHGAIDFEVREKELKTLIFLTLPIERRRAVYYHSIHA